jgi:hypothetical protein
MKAAGDAALELMVTYYGDERGRKFDILANDQAIAAVELAGGKRDQFVDVVYTIPASVVRSATERGLIVKFAAKESSRTASVFGVRVLERVASASSQ